MYKIAVVDDEYIEVERISGLLSKYSSQAKYDFEIFRFSSGEEFLASDYGSIDIVFLDIEMAALSGLDTAREIRKTNQSIIIIFCTKLVQYAINGYEVNALGYLVKPVQEYSFNLYISKACNLLCRRLPSKINIKTVHGQIVLKTNDIIYVEVQRHNLFFYLKTEGGIDTVRTRGSMSDISDKLPADSFVRCNTSYLINLQYVQSIEYNSVCLPKSKLPISRNHKKKFCDSFMKYLVENEVASI